MGETCIANGKIIEDVVIQRLCNGLTTIIYHPDLGLRLEVAPLGSASVRVSASHSSREVNEFIFSLIPPEWGLLLSSGN